MSNYNCNEPEFLTDVELQLRRIQIEVCNLRFALELFVNVIESMNKRLEKVEELNE